MGSATELVQGADDILRAQNDPGAYAARAKLAASLEALRALPEPDRTGLFVQLAALREQVNQLQPLTPTFKEGESGASNVAWGDGNSTWGCGGRRSRATSASTSMPARTFVRCWPASNWRRCA